MHGSQIKEMIAALRAPGFDDLEHLRYHSIMSKFIEARALDFHEQCDLGSARQQLHDVTQQRQTGTDESIPEALGLRGIDVGQLRGVVLERRCAAIQWCATAGDRGSPPARRPGSDCTSSSRKRTPSSSADRNAGSVFSGNSAALPRCATKCISRAAFKDAVPPTPLPPLRRFPDCRLHREGMAKVGVLVPGAKYSQMNGTFSFVWARPGATGSAVPGGA